MKPHEIKAAMVFHKVSQKEIATTLGISGPAVSMVVSGVTTSKPVMELIAKRCNRDPHRMWGRRLDSPRGRPRKQA